VRPVLCMACAKEQKIVAAIQSVKQRCAAYRHERGIYPDMLWVGIDEWRLLRSPEASRASVLVALEYVTIILDGGMAAVSVYLR
jgi:hypothetical protein